jgi:hypothetical protein
MRLIAAYSLTFVVLLLLPSFVSANTGWWQNSHEERDIMALISPSRFSIFPNEKIDMIISVVNMSRAEETTDPREFYFGNITAVIRIMKVSTNEIIYSSDTTYSENGFIDFSYSFPTEGLHELMLQVNRNGMTYNFDFPIVPRDPKQQNVISSYMLSILLLVGAAIGFVAGWIFRSKAGKNP